MPDSELAASACLHDTVSLASSSAAQGHLHMGLVLGIGVVLRPLGELLGDDILVQRHQARLHLLLHLPSYTWHC